MNLNDLSKSELKAIEAAADYFDPEAGEAAMRAVAADFGITFDEEYDMADIDAEVCMALDAIESKAKLAAFDASLANPKNYTAGEIFARLESERRRLWVDRGPAAEATDKQLWKLAHLMAEHGCRSLDFGFTQGGVNKKAISMMIDDYSK